jgi:DNA-binding protein HU-beta
LIEVTPDLKEEPVNKRDLVESIADDAQITRIQATKALEAFVRSVQSSLVNGDRVTLVGFGTFVVSHRKARMVREPRSGITMEIKATRVARFAAGLELKAALANARKADS